MNDALVEAVKPTFKTREAVNEWLQNQATLLLQPIVARQKSEEPDGTTRKQIVR